MRSPLAPLDKGGSRRRGDQLMHIFCLIWYQLSSQGRRSRLSQVGLSDCSLSPTTTKAATNQTVSWHRKFLKILKLWLLAI